EEETQNYREHRQQQIGHRRNKIAAQFLTANNPDVSHPLAPAATTSGSAGGAADAIASPVSCRKTSSRLTAAGRSSFKSQPASTTARAKSPRVNPPLPLSTSKIERFSRLFFKTTRFTPET